jgi:hypothetical protein
MISLGARYIDYGLTGGFFLFVALAVFGWHHPEVMSALLKNFQEYQGKLSAGEMKALETLANGVFASLFVVCIFATGLLLDLFGSLLGIWELDIFRKYVKRNKEWIGQLTAKYAEFLGEDFNLISTKSTVWQRLDLRTGFHPLLLTAPFNRIESILISHLLLTADPARLELLMDQMRTCRIARAVSLGVLVLSVATYVIPTIEGRHIGLSVLAIYFVGFALSVVMVRRAYSKLCSGLFSLLFVLQRMRTT